MPKIYTKVLSSWPNISKASLSSLIWRQKLYVGMRTVKKGKESRIHPTFAKSWPWHLPTKSSVTFLLKSPPVIKKYATKSNLEHFLLPWITFVTQQSLSNSIYLHKKWGKNEQNGHKMTNCLPKSYKCVAFWAKKAYNPYIF